MSQECLVHASHAMPVGTVTPVVCLLGLVLGGWWLLRNNEFVCLSHDAADDNPMSPVSGSKWGLPLQAQFCNPVILTTRFACHC